MRPSKRRTLRRLNRSLYTWCVPSNQDAGEYLEARQLLDEGEAYISMPTQQKVMIKVCTEGDTYVFETQHTISDIERPRVNDLSQDLSRRNTSVQR